MLTHSEIELWDFQNRMARPFFIIDGYNLMHAWGLARSRYGPGDLERLRGQFLKELAKHFTEEELPRTTVVFDAGEDAPSDVSADHRANGLRVVYALREADADTRIEHMIASHSAPRQICVVSSDRRLQTAARRRKGRFLTSEQFLAQRSRVEDDGSAPQISRELEAKFSGEMTETERDEWLEIFGDSEDQND